MCSYLHELQVQAREQDRSPSVKRSADAAFGNDVQGDGSPDDTATQQGEERPLRTIDHGRSIWTSPFTLPSRTIKNTHKNGRSWSESTMRSATLS